MPATTPRTLADQLRGWSDEQLAALLEARPDLATPAPHDSSQLAARVVVRASVLRALDGLDALDLGRPPVAGAGHRPARPPGAPPDAVDGALERLRTLALVWGPPDRPVLVVTELLRRPHGPDPPRCPRCSAELDPPAPRRCSTTCWRPVPTAAGAAAPAPPPGWSPRGLLARLDERHVTLPWTVRLALRSRRRTPAGRAPPAGDHRAARRPARPRRGRRRVRARAPHRAAPRPLGHPPARRPEARRPRRARPARRPPTLLHVETDVAALVIETAAARRAARPGHDRRARRGLAADRRLRRLAARRHRPAVGHPRPGLAGQPPPGGRGRRPHRRQAGQRPLPRHHPQLARRPCATTRWPSCRAPGRRRARQRHRRVLDGASGCAGAGRAAPPHGSRQVPPCSPRPPCSASPGSTASPASAAGSSPPTTPPRRSTGCCPPRSTTSCCRPTSPPSLRGRSSRSWRASWPWSPTSSPAAARPSTASRPRPCAGPSTRAGRPPRCTSSSRPPPARRCRSR